MYTKKNIISLVKHVTLMSRDNPRITTLSPLVICSSIGCYILANAFASLFTLPLEARERWQRERDKISFFFGCPYLKKDPTSNAGNLLLQRSYCNSLVTLAERRIGNLSVLILCLWIVRSGQSWIQKTYVPYQWQFILDVWIYFL